MKTKSKRLQFKDLYDDYNMRVRQIVYFNLQNSDVNDVVQDIFVKVWKSLDKFKQEAKVTTWLYRITMNTIYDYYRKNKNNKDMFEFTEGMLADGVNAEKVIDDKNLVTWALKKLPRKQRDVVTMYYLLDQNIEEISEILAVSKGTVKSRLHYAKTSLTDILVENEREI